MSHARYWAVSYVDDRISAEELIARVYDAVSASGLEYLGLLRRELVEQVAADNARAALATALSSKRSVAELTGKLTGDSGLRLVFHAPFGFADDTWKRLEQSGLAGVVRHVHVGFDFRPGDHNAHLPSPHYVVTSSTWEEYVLVYGTREHHEENRRLIHQLSQAIHERCGATFSWLDGQMNATDHSLEGLMQKGDPDGNKRVIISPPLVEKLDRERVGRRGAEVIELAGSIVVDNPNSFGLEDLFGRE